MTSFAPPRLAQSKSGVDVLYDMKHEQLQHNEQAAVSFLNAVLEDHPDIVRENLHQELKDGVLLCNLVNKLKPGTIKHVGQRDLSFIKMDNITRFLQGARQLGLEDSQLFDTIDLFEAKDMPAVVQTILIIAQKYSVSNDKESVADKEPGEKIAEKETVQAIELNEKETDNNDGNSTDKAVSSWDDTGLGASDDSAAHTSPHYRDVRDIFGTTDKDSLRVSTQAIGRAQTSVDITRQSGGDDCASFKRPPKSPLRPMSKPNQRSNSMRRAHRRRKSAEDVRSNRRPSAPAFSSQSKAGVNVNSDIVPMSRTSSASSCSSFLSSTSSSNSFPETPITPPSRHLHEGEQTKTRSKSMDHRRQSLYLQHQQRHTDYQEETTTNSLGRKLDRHLLKSMEAIKQDEKDREKLMLKSKDGLTRVQYQLGNCIGKGQFGSVYRALDLGTGETVAVKRIRLEDAELDQEIMKEVSLLKTLSHSNVIQYLGFIRSKHHINIVLEYAENGSLMSTLKAFGSFPEKLVASFCIKILNGLEYLHANEVVHCDLKAANILTTKTGDVKLSDFGVSLNLKIKGADAGSVSGTPNWMAPEVIELKGASTKADIWSLGCTLVELITGKPPYADMIAMSAMFRIVEDDYPPIPEGISPELHSFLLCCFQKNPHDRPTASQLKEHNWIRNNQRRMKKNDTASNGLSSYLDQQKRNAAKDGHASTTSSRGSRRRSSHRVSNATYDSACHPLDNASVSSHHTTGHQSHTHHPHHHPQTPTPSRRSIERPRSGIYEAHTPIAIPHDYITHRFIQTSFGKAVECKVCGDLIKSQTIFCEACALICHEECKKLAFSCPPKVNDQQPSYDWVFSAKIYNRSRDDRSGSQDSARSMPEVTLNRLDMFSSLENHPQAESIRKYSRALGLTPQEQRALSQNQALLSHTLALQHMEPEAVKTLIKKSNKDRKKGNGSDEDCIIS